MPKKTGGLQLLKEKDGVMIGKRGLTVRRFDKKYYLFSGNKFSNGKCGGDDIKSVQISSHGGATSKWRGEDPWFTVPKGMRLYFYGPHEWVLSDYGFQNILRKSPRPYEIYEGGEKCRSYSLSKYQGKHGEKTETYEAIMALVRSRLIDEKNIEGLSAVGRALREDGIYKQYKKSILECQEKISKNLEVIKGKGLLTDKTFRTLTLKDIDDTRAGIQDGSLLGDADKQEKGETDYKLLGMRGDMGKIANNIQYAENLESTYSLMDMCTVRNVWSTFGGVFGGTLKTAVKHLHELGYTDVHCSFCRGGKEEIVMDGGKPKKDDKDKVVKKGYSIDTHNKEGWIPLRPGRRLTRKRALRNLF